MYILLPCLNRERENREQQLVEQECVFKERERELKEREYRERQRREALERELHERECREREMREREKRIKDLHEKELRDHEMRTAKEREMRQREARAQVCNIYLTVEVEPEVGIKYSTVGQPLLLKLRCSGILDATDIKATLPFYYKMKPLIYLESPIGDHSRDSSCYCSVSVFAG